ncbi:GP88 family protein [Actinophytocola sp.]|uniref:GP88 family protein n=1 Tax=Actinophytocola sp. TaxID=1872138 RepID=UPI003C783B5C
MTPRGGTVLLRQNRRLRALRIYNWSLPALAARLPDGRNVKVCPSAGVCASVCYARSTRNCIERKPSAVPELRRWDFTANLLHHRLNVPTCRFAFDLPSDARFFQRTEGEHCGQSGRAAARLGAVGAGWRRSAAAPRGRGAERDAGRLGEAATGRATAAAGNDRQPPERGSPVRQVHQRVPVAMDRSSHGRVDGGTGDGAGAGGVDAAQLPGRDPHVLRLHHLAPLRLGPRVRSAIRHASGADRARVEHRRAPGGLRGRARSPAIDSRGMPGVVRLRRRPGREGGAARPQGCADRVPRCHGPESPLWMGDCASPRPASWNGSTGTAIRRLRNWASSGCSTCAGASDPEDRRRSGGWWPPPCRGPWRPSRTTWPTSGRDSDCRIIRRCG